MTENYLSPSSLFCRTSVSVLAPGTCFFVKFSLIPVERSIFWRLLNLYSFLPKITYLGYTLSSFLTFRLILSHTRFNRKKKQNFAKKLNCMIMCWHHYAFWILLTSGFLMWYWFQHYTETFYLSSQSSPFIRGAKAVGLLTGRLTKISMVCNKGAKFTNTATTSEM